MKQQPSNTMLLGVAAFLALVFWAQCYSHNECKDRGGVLVKGVVTYECVALERR